MIYVILGQTASGKTSVSLKLARKHKLPMISADAYQCYRMMQIGTDKPTSDMVSGIDCYFYDCYEPDVDMDVYTFQTSMRKVLDEYEKKNIDVLVVGGTFLYIKALLYPYDLSSSMPNQSPYRNMPLDEMQKQLKEKDPETYGMIDVNNPRRVIRALEQIDQGISRKDILAKNDNQPLYPVSFYRIDIDKEQGNKKIDERVEKMFREGIVDEVKNLVKQYGENHHSFLAIGYKEIIQCLKENRSVEEMKELIKIHTHQYAKKQRTFLAHQFTDVISGSKEEVYEFIDKDIERRKIQKISSPLGDL